MTDKDVVALVIALFVLVVPLSLGLALWVVAKLCRRSDRPPFPSGTGGTVVPVRRLMRTFGIFGRSHNSISPRLEVAVDGLRFKVFKPDHWRFDDIAEVDAPWAPFATRVAIRKRSGGHLYIDLADQARARDLLHAFPTAVPFTARAVTSRDGRT